MEVTSLFGQFVPNFNFANVCFQPDILLSEVNAVDYVKEISSNTDSNPSNDFFENKSVQEEIQEARLDPGEIEENDCAAVGDIEEEDCLTDNNKKPKLRRVRWVFLYFFKCMFGTQKFLGILPRNTDAILARTLAPQRKRF